MNRRSFLAAAAAAPLAAAQDTAETGFTPLFNGRTLDGWTVKDGPESAFYVADGAIEPDSSDCCAIASGAAAAALKKVRRCMAVLYPLQWIHMKLRAPASRRPGGRC